MHRRDLDSEGRPLDPQDLTLGAKIRALLSLGRIPLASEVPLWCFFGCLLSSQIFPIDGTGSSDSGKTLNSHVPISIFQNFDPWVTLQCVLIVWGTNLSINYGNEYFDYDLDRPGMVAAIKRDLKERKALQAKKEEIESKAVKGEEVDHEEVFEVDARADQENDKIMGSTTRIIHDGTFPPITALLCSGFIQFLLLLLITLSRQFDHYDPTSNPGTSSSSTLLSSSSSSRSISPFRGVALHIGLICTFLSQTYVGPPLRLHYNGFGELVSALLLSPVSALFGLLGHYTAVSGRPLSFSDIYVSASSTVTSWFTSASASASTPAASSTTGFSLDTQLITLLLAFYFYEQARILIMHIQDIEADQRGGKITMTVRLGFTRASRLYVVLNVIAVSLFTAVAFQLTTATGSRMGTGAGRRLDSSQTPGSGFGSLLRLLGDDLSPAGARIKATAWIASFTAVMCYAIPIMSITAKSLFAIDPAVRARLEGGSKKANKANEVDGVFKSGSSVEVDGMLERNGSEVGSGSTRTNSTPAATPTLATSNAMLDFIPVLPHKQLAMIVSLQMLLTPVVLSIGLAVGSFLAARAG